jgi:DNA-binding transcriptional LysR family regulator
MDRLDAMRAFLRVVERRSFIAAAQDLMVPRSRVSEAVQQLERRLGVRLLVRTTRQVKPTAEGEDYYRRVLGILDAIDDADAAVSDDVPNGPLRIDVHGTFARRFLLPALPQFLDEHPGIRLHVGEGDRLVDLVGEGVDCVIRIGDPADSGLVGRKLGVVAEGTFASPGYLARHGTPTSPDDLQGRFVSTATRAVIPLEFGTGESTRMITLPAAATVSASSTNAYLAKLGLGLIQVPRYRVAHELATGALVEVLADWVPAPSPVYMLYLEGRQLSPRVRLFIDWATAVVSAELDRT